MNVKFLSAVTIVSALLFSGCASSASVNQNIASITKEYQIENINFEDAYALRGDGTRSGSKAIFVDVRSLDEYNKGTIPSARNINDLKASKEALAETPKEKEFVIFGKNADDLNIKESYDFLKNSGFNNIKIYAGGADEWFKRSFLEIGVPVAHEYFKVNGAVMYDARPYTMFLKETIPGAFSFVDSDVEKNKGRFPTDKNTKIITFCSGFECPRSAALAESLLKLGYTDVSVFTAGVPGWKKASLPTTAPKKSDKPKVVEKKPDVFVDGIKLGVDEGTVDGEWFKDLVLKDKVPNNVAIIDLRKQDTFGNGHIKNAIHIPSDSFSVDKLPKDKFIILYCYSGATGMETRMKLAKANVDVSRILYFDARVNCDQKSCKIEVNEPLD